MQMHAHFCGKRGVSNKDRSGTILCSVPALNIIVASFCSLFLNAEELAPFPAPYRKYPKSRKVHAGNADVLPGGW